MALAGIQSANASPVFSPICFESEEAAQKHHDAQSGNQTPNIEARVKISHANELIRNGEVRLSVLESILGAPDSQTDKNSHSPIQKWTIGFLTKTVVGTIQYNSQTGYCVPTRNGRFSFVKFTWHGSGYDSPYGLADMQTYGW